MSLFAQAEADGHPVIVALRSQSCASLPPQVVWHADAAPLAV